MKAGGAKRSADDSSTSAPDADALILVGDLPLSRELP